MSKKSFTRVLLVGLAIFVPILCYSLLCLNPKMGVTAIVTLLVSVFFTLIFGITLIGFFLRSRASNNEALFIAFRTSLRQGFLVGFYALGILALAAIKLLTWWDALLLALSLVLFEIYFKSSKEMRI